MDGQVVIDIGGTRLNIRTGLPAAQVERVESCVNETLVQVRRGRELSEQQSLVLALLTMADRLLDAEAALEMELERKKAASERLGALIQQAELAL